ncbi:hypothetical protein M231_01844 [Tremella mesenterica]|uniref:Uncharacterized protein n=1 Tax=Tremella mesenterica TaxID=5217 RepID=A0A4Q1BS19_TREME|nr:hypothetical protein M231_01844 [Tremella mesenterica]
MIRSNPTAIPLRASDLKLLQSSRPNLNPQPSQTNPTDQPNPSTQPFSPSQNQARQGQGAQQGVIPTGTERGTGEGVIGSEENRRVRQGMTVAERIVGRWTMDYGRWKGDLCPEIRYEMFTEKIYGSMPGQYEPVD